MKPTRKQISDALDTMPVSHILGKGSKELTGKQRRFALEVAKGSTKAGAYRSVYSATAKPKTAGDAGSRLSGNPRIVQEVEAYRLALQAAEYRSPAAVRALVIQSLVQVVIDPESKASVRVAAAKVLGTVTEVAAFTERKQVTRIDASSTARQALLEHLSGLMSERIIDPAVSIDNGAADADALLAELVDMGENEAAEPHPAPTPQPGVPGYQPPIHSTPHEQSENFTDLDTPPLQNSAKS